MKVLEDTRNVWLFLLQIVSFLGIAVLGVFYCDLNEQLLLLKTDTFSHKVSKRSSPSSTMNRGSTSAPNSDGGPGQRPDTTTAPGNPEIHPAFPSHTGNRGQSAAAYVQWGNSRCAQDSVSIYRGFIAGPHVTNIDQGTDLQCMPRQRDSSTSATGRPLSTNGDSYIGVVQFELPPDISTSDSVIMCSLCYVPGKSLQVMIPGRLTCPDYLKHVYNGWLMEAGRRGDTEDRRLSLSNQICMAQDAETMPGLADNSAIKLSHVRFGSSCGAAGSPCSRYSDSQAIPCCVCTQKDI